MHLRAAAGVCALSTGLLIAGPAIAIAAADAGSDGTPSNASAASSTAKPRGPIANLTESLGKGLQDTAQNAVQGVTGTLSSLGKSGAQASSVTKPPKMNFGGTPTVHGSTGADLAEPTAPDNTATDTTATDFTAAEVPANGGAAPAAPQPNVVTPSTPTFPAAAVPVIPDVVVPVSNVFGAVDNSVAGAPALLASLPTSTTPVSDVIGALQTMLTSVVNAGAPLAQLPSDLSELLGVVTTIPVTTIPGAIPGVGTDRIGSPATADMPTPMPVLATTTLLPGLPGFGLTPPPEVLGGSATLLDVKTAGSGAAVTGSNVASAAAPAGASVLSIVERVIGAVVATVSVTALLAMALPGILGLLGTCAAGIRIGYRQAKAGSELPATAIARFVGSGPVGVVRSGSQISLRPRVVRPASRRAPTPGADSPVRTSTLRLLDRAV